MLKSFGVVEEFLQVTSNDLTKHRKTTLLEYLHSARD